MNHKCIILSRVSTESQHLDEQEKNLYDMAIKDGYLKENIITISDKESGIRLTEEERSGLIQLKKYIDSDKSIDCVYLWELSRLTRHAEVLFKFRNLFFDNGIQLKVFTPQFCLLNEDKTINENSNLILSLQSALIESEMRTKKERFRRGKQRAAKIGKYLGGAIRYGYSVDENGYLIINEKEAKIVRLIYDLYINKGFSQFKLYKELTDRGLNISYNLVNEILHFIGYAGLELKNGIEKKYPKIIDIKIYNKARKIAEENNHNINKAKSIYFCRGLLICPTCGFKLIAAKTDKEYKCMSYINRKRTENNVVSCKDVSININLLDSIVWECAKEAEIIWLLKNHEEEIKQFEEKVTVNDGKIEVTKASIQSLLSKKDRNNDMYIEGNISKVKYNENVGQINLQIENIKANIQKWNKENKDYNEQINSLKDNGKKKNMRDIIDNIATNVYGIKNQQLMYDIIHKHFKKIVVTTEIIHKTKIITIYNKLNIRDVYRVNIYTKKLERNMTIEPDLDNDPPFWVDVKYDYLKRF